MLHYLLLTSCTIIIVFLAWQIWKKTKQIAFIIGIGLLYYWSLLGSWFIIYDELTLQNGKNFGLAYYDYLIKLFPVHADKIYYLVISYYSIFIIVIELTVLYFTKKKEFNIESNFKPIYISHFWLITFCLSATIISFIIIWTQILIAAKFHQSVYYITRNYHDNYYTIHQILNQVAIVSLYIGFITFLSSKSSTYLTGSQKNNYIWAYAIAIFIIEGYLLFIGNKREIFFGGILGILFIIINMNNRINYKKLLVFFAIIIVPLFLNDGLRSYSPTFLTNYFNVSDLEFHPKEEISYTTFTAKNTVFRFIFSNEMFVPHFSMYGILSHNIPLTYGTSLVSLSASIVPHFLWHDRPEGIYEYYATQVNAKPGTGYTIHHASAWYLNFGVLGILLGAFIFGIIWTFLYNQFNNLLNIRFKFFKIIYIIGFIAFTSNIASLIRGGPEAYKALVFEAILIPSFVIFVASIIESIIKKKH
ncbi:MAG: hypothetical protein A2033_11085 [Bacteroidetes bacterium GWA2_31_9]|nr:MAG: hypothetical protein A2033_11085 [Bacteroidetes bacterium GWA2_31_9]